MARRGDDRQRACAHALATYYEERAAEYDATSYEPARADAEARLHLEALELFVAGLPPARVLDVGCGTGWLTRLLRGRVVGLDPSPSMLRLAARRLSGAVLVRGSSPPLPFLDRAFDRVFTSHVYGHLEDGMRHEFVCEALRVADELVVVEQRIRAGVAPQGWQERALLDGRVHCVYKRYFSAEGLARELGGEVALDSPAFVAARVCARGMTFGRRCRRS